MTTWYLTAVHEQGPSRLDTSVAWSPGKHVWRVGMTRHGCEASTLDREDGQPASINGGA